MPFPKKSSAAANLLPADPAQATSDMEARLAVARANLAEHSRTLGEAVLAAADSATINAARKSVETAHAEIASLEAGLQAAQALATANAEAATVSAEEARKQALEAALAELRAAAIAVDAALPALAIPMRALLSAQQTVGALAGQFSALGSQLTTATRAIMPALSWHIRRPINVSKLVQDEHSSSGWRMHVPGGAIVTDDSQVLLEPVFSGLRADK